MMHSCRGQSHVYVSLHFSKQVKQWPHLIQILTQIKHLIKLYRCNSIDNTEKPQYITVGITASNTEPFCKETTVYLGTTGTDLCPVAAMLDYIMQWGNHPGPTFQFQDYHPLTRPRLVTELREAQMELKRIHTSMRATVTVLEQPPLLHCVASKTPPLRCWAGGKVVHILCRLIPRLSPCSNEK